MRKAELRRAEVFLRWLGVRTVRRAAVGGRGRHVRDGKIGSKQKDGEATVPLGLSNL